MENAILQKSIKDVLKTHYNLKALEISAIDSGVRNKSFIIDACGKKYVLRIYASNRTREHISFELETMILLSKSNFPIPIISNNSEGELLTTASVNGEEKYLILMDFMTGKPISSSDLHIIEPLAVLQAKMHLVLKEIKPRKNINEVLNDWSKWSKEEREKMRPILKSYKFESIYLKHFDEIRGKTEILFNKIASVPYGECHNDFFGDNILIENNKITAVLDFDNLSTAPLIFDVANTIFSWLFHSSGVDIAVIKKYIASYQTQRRFLERELELLLPLIAIRNFAVTNSLYTHNFVKGHERIEKTLKFYKGFSIYKNTII